MVRKNQFFTVLIVFLLAGCPGWALAGTYSGGTGEPNDPYRIATAEDLNDIGNHVEDFDKCFVLVADINLADYTGKQFNIIGRYYGYQDPNSKAFAGVFDGNGFAILNFTYEANDIDSVGLFGRVDDPNAEIRNLTLIDPNVHVVGYGFNVGALVGWMKDGTVTGCSVQGGNVTGGDTVGGLVGGNQGTISNCYATGSVTGEGKVGGLVGANWGWGTISACQFTGTVSGEYANVGGLVGENDFGTISNSHVTGSVTGFKHVGGLTGSSSHGELINSSVTGEVIGFDWVGGLVGYSIVTPISDCWTTCIVTGLDDISECVGGLVGWHDMYKISNCYATGAVTGGERVGGLVGHLMGGPVSNCHATGSVNGEADVGGLVGVSFDEISGSYATGAVSGGSKVGGLVGVNIWVICNSYATGSVGGDDKIGGLVGENYYGGVYDCYAAGSVSGNTDTGGFVGYEFDYPPYCYSPYTVCFWDKTVNPSLEGIGNTSDPNVIGKSTTEMQQESTFTDAGWDFVEIWDIGENQTYPFLRQYPAGDINHDDKVNFLDVAIIADHWLEYTGPQ